MIRKLLLAVLPLAVAGCSGGPLDPHGPIAAQQRIILLDALAIMLAIVIPTVVGAVWVAWWFRESNRKALYEPDFTYSGRIEILVWSIPTLVILFLGGVIWVGSHQLDPSVPIESREKTVEIQVVSLDWKWLFIYPEQKIATVNSVTIPAGTPVHFSITAGSVLNTFFVPQLGGMIYAMNGMVTQLNLMADHPGDFEGRSGHFSGDDFSDMHFTVHAIPRWEFDGFVAKTKAEASEPILDLGAYAQLSRQSVLDRPFEYRSIDPGLFKAVAMQQVAPGPGPEVGSPAVNVHPETAEK